MIKLKELLWVWLGCLTVVGLAAAFQSSPGYMDAEYYYAGGKLLWQGHGFEEPYLWNYLTDPRELPVPSHTYWMPLASLWAWLGMSLVGSDAFQAARWPFILLGSLVSPLTYWLGWKISQQRFTSLLAALFAWFPMFYLAYLPTTDTFAMYMILGTLWLVLAARVAQLKDKSVFLAGLICGAMHLARADGFFWMLVFLLLIVREGFIEPRHPFWLQQLRKITIFIAGYALLMGGWYGRNLLEYRSPFPPGNERALFLRNYNDLYRYPASDLSLEYLLGYGLVPLVYDRLHAAGQNLLSLIAVQAQILLAPLFILGFWKRKREPIVARAAAVWLVMFALMSFVFPYAGWRGGYFHVAAAFQPLVWSLASEGFGVFVQWGVRKRGWSPISATQVFAFFVLGMLMILTVYLYCTRVIGKDVRNPVWDEAHQRQVKICAKLRGITNAEGIEDWSVMINNPVGFYLACEKRAVSVPVGGLTVVQLVARQYGIEFLVLERDHPAEISPYFYRPADTSFLTLLDNQKEWKVYRFHASR